MLLLLFSVNDEVINFKRNIFFNFRQVLLSFLLMLHLQLKMVGDMSMGAAMYGSQNHYRQYGQQLVIQAFGEVLEREVFTLSPQTAPLETDRYFVECCSALESLAKRYYETFIPICNIVKNLVSGPKKTTPKQSTNSRYGKVVKSFGYGILRRTFEL